MKLNLTTAPQPKPDFNKLVFGKVLTDHMLEMDYADGKWGEPTILPVHKFEVGPSMMVFHYGQAIFEGCKAFRNSNDEVTLFRLRDNLNRMNLSATRMSMPTFDVDQIFDAIYKLVNIDRLWIPNLEKTSLYLRPTMIATEEIIGLRSSKKFKFFVIMSPVGAYQSGGFAPSRILIEDHYIRCAIGGTGEAKCSGNYAGSFAASELAAAKGFNQVAWLDARDRKYIEEVGAMNLFFRFRDEVVTPMLTGSILRGITRDSIIKLLKSQGVNIVERKISVKEIFKAHKKGQLLEVFGAGTAAIVSPIGYLEYQGQGITINNGETGDMTKEVFDKVYGIQTKKYPDPYGWVVDVK